MTKLPLSIEHKNISLGFSSCPNDTFMFAAMVNHWIDTKGFEFTVHMEDVETLNEWASSEKLDLTKMSFHRSLDLEDRYQLLSSGAALGNGCGPLLIAKKQLSKDQLMTGPIALPGRWTTAHLLFSIFYPEVTNKQFMRFDHIEDAVLQEHVVAGVIIHENRFTYENKGLVKIMDLGDAWEQKTTLPIPLGGIFASKRIGEADLYLLESLIRDSISFAFSQPEKVMPYVRMHAQEIEDHVIQQHIDLYVNDFSLDLGEKGKKSIALLKKNHG